MAYPQIYPRAIVEPIDDSTAASLRSRASSIITTTTKFSLETLSQDDRSSIGAQWDRHHPSHANRPRSTMSMTSIAHPAPPYDEAVDPTFLLPSHENGHFETEQSLQTENRVPRTDTPSISEALPPSPPRSGTTTLSPESPLDLEENPHAQAAYYSNVVRTLDQNYTAAIERLRQEHVQQLALTRHDIDQAYRAQWKAKNQQIERIREEAAAAKDLEVEKIRSENELRVQTLEERVSQLERELGEQTERQDAAVEKARHEIEDIWEKRWSDRNKVENEEKARIEATWQSRLDRGGFAAANPSIDATISSQEEGRDRRLANILRGEILRQRRMSGDHKVPQQWDEVDLLEALVYTLETGKIDRLLLYQQDHGTAEVKPTKQSRTRWGSGPDADTIRQILHNLDNTTNMGHGVSRAAVTEI
ncbi:MAG: hypothetical protein Q9218_001876 [Villophora microphyllina]